MTTASPAQGRALDLRARLGADHPVEAYLTGAEGPGVLLFMDAIGLRPRLREMADRIASWGYVVLVPNVFHREGDAASLAPTEDLHGEGARERFFAKAMPRVGRLVPELSEPDSDVWLEVLAEHAEAGAVGVVGYCMGARLALRAAARHGEAVAACAGFHGGGLATDAEDSPHLGADRVRAEVLLAHADGDASMPPQAIARLAAALKEAGVRQTSTVYAGAPHGYSMSDTPMYDAAAAARHFDDLRDLLDRALMRG